MFWYVNAVASVHRLPQSVVASAVAIVAVVVMVAMVVIGVVDEGAVAEVGMVKATAVVLKAVKGPLRRFTALQLLLEWILLQVIPSFAKVVMVLVACAVGRLREYSTSCAEKVMEGYLDHQRYHFLLWPSNLRLRGMSSVGRPQIAHHRVLELFPWQSEPCVDTLTTFPAL